jgi:hypothetical protein
MNTEILDLQSVLTTYLQTALPEYKSIIKKGPMAQDLPQKFILVYDNGGTYSVFDQNAQPEIQILTQSVNSDQSHVYAIAVLNKVKELYDYTLSGIKIIKIKSNTLPQPLGNVGNGLFQHSFNLEIIYQLGETQE